MRTGGQKQNIVEDFVSQVNPYEKMTPLKFDMRNYSKYVKENKLTAKEITPEMLQKFARGGENNDGGRLSHGDF